MMYDPREDRFAVAIALTSDHALMGCGFLAKLRQFHPRCDLFIFTDEESLDVAAAISGAFGGLPPVVTDRMGFDCLEWGSIVTSKFRVFSLPTEKPVLFLDIDQIITRALYSYVDFYVENQILIAGGADDELLGAQFRFGSTPLWLDPAEDKVINTGAFIARPDRDIFNLIRKSIPIYSGLTRLPTQGLLNGILHEYKIPYHVFGDDFMIGPFNRRICDIPTSAALIHLWTPRPPFMYPNPLRVGVDGDLTWEECVASFDHEVDTRYPYEHIRTLYLEQIELFETTVGMSMPMVIRPEQSDDYRRHRQQPTELVL